MAKERMTIAQRQAKDPDAVKYKAAKQAKERAKLAAAQARQAAEQKAAGTPATSGRSATDQITGRGAGSVQENIGERATGIRRLLKKFGIGS